MKYKNWNGEFSFSGYNLDTIGIGAKRKGIYKKTKKDELSSANDRRY